MLREFAEVLRSQVREGDVACRTGGEEFCVVLPKTSLAQRLSGWRGAWLARCAPRAWAHEGT